MALKAFDVKFGEQFFGSLPTSPAVYRIYDDADALIYVGKAKNLRRRLGQYRNAKRRKAHRKMRLIVSDASRIEYQCCESEREACLLEAELIQSLRPKWNVDGAYFFLYPMIGLRENGENLEFIYTSQPDLFPDFSFHGCYRSRHHAGEAFFSLMRLLRYVGHAAKTPKRPSLPKYTYVSVFRRLPPEWAGLWAGFFRGESKAAIEELVLALVENAGARRSGRKIQDQLNDVARFWRVEIQPFARARALTGYAPYPVPQHERDALFLRYRFAKRGEVAQ